MGACVSTPARKQRADAVRYLQLSGSGAKCLTLLGTHTYLAGHTTQIRGAVGHSSAALVVLLIALKAPTELAVEILMQCTNAGMFGPIRIARTCSDWKTVAMLQCRVILRTLFKRSGVTDSVTLADFRVQSAFDLRIAVLSHHSRHLMLLSADTTPHVNVLDAVLIASISPVFFVPQPIRGLTGRFTSHDYSEILPDQWPLDKSAVCHVLLDHQMHVWRRLSVRDDRHARTLLIQTPRAHGPMSAYVRHGRHMASLHFQTSAFTTSARLLIRRVTSIRSLSSKKTKTILPTVRHLVLS